MLYGHALLTRWSRKHLLSLGSDELQRHLSEPQHRRTQLWHLWGCLWSRQSVLQRDLPEPGD